MITNCNEDDVVVKFSGIVVAVSPISTKMYHGLRIDFQNGDIPLALLVLCRMGVTNARTATS
jgi:Fe-S cluster assembly iron-binding protein IscA